MQSYFKSFTMVPIALNTGLNLLTILLTILLNKEIKFSKPSLVNSLTFFNIKYGQRRIRL